MPTRNNPFKPNKPVHSEIFTGRINEIEKIENSIISTIDGNANHLLFIGERGIGKTSLLLLANYLSKGDISISDIDEEVKFLTIYLSLDKNISKADFCRKIQMQIEKSFRDQLDKLQLLKDIWKFVQRIEVAGSKINHNNSITENEIVDNLISSISETVKHVKTMDEGYKDGIVF